MIFTNVKDFHLGINSKLGQEYWGPGESTRSTTKGPLTDFGNSFRKDLQSNLLFRGCWKTFTKSCVQKLTISEWG